MDNAQDKDKLNTIKGIIEPYKGWFDYAACCLGVATWFAATVSVAVLNWRLSPSWFEYGFTVVNLALLPALVYGFFLFWTLKNITSAAEAMLIARHAKSKWHRRVIVSLMWIWNPWGLYGFILTLTIHLILIVLYQLSNTLPADAT